MEEDRCTVAAAGGTLGPHGNIGRGESIITTLGWNADPVNKPALEEIFSRDAGL
jgi:hypothetical protein